MARKFRLVLEPKDMLASRVSPPPKALRIRPEADYIEVAVRTRMAERIW